MGSKLFKCLKSDQEEPIESGSGRKARHRRRAQNQSRNRHHQSKHRSTVIKPPLPRKESSNDQHEIQRVSDTTKNPVCEPSKVDDRFIDIAVIDAEAFDEIFIQQRQQAIDNHFYQTTIQSWQPESVQQLVDTIKTFSNGKSLIDCHWIIFYWIAINIEYDTVAYFAKDYKDQSAEGVFQRRRGVCAGYANIYKYLCDQLEISCEVAGGYSKGYGFDEREGAPSETDHAWNAVQIDQHWYLVESTWGAGNIDDKKEFQRQLKTYYFLARPNEMIYHHLPEQPKWQLLQTPITMTQYMQMPKIHPPFFQLNLEIVNPRNQAYVDFLPDKPYALVAMRAPSNVHLIASLKLNDQKIDGGHRVVFNNEQQLYHCYFAPPTTGKYKITIYGKQNDAESVTYDGVVDFMFNVKQMPLKPISFPETWKIYFDLGLEVISPENTHLLKLNDGSDHIQIKIKAPSEVHLISRLKNEQGEKLIGGDCVYYDRQKDIWQCKFAPDRNGLFDACIMAKKKSDPGHFTSAVSFKIDAKNIPSPPLSFPKTWQPFYDLDMQIKTPKGQGTIVLSKKESEVEIQITTPDNVDLLSRLSDDNDQEIRSGSQVVFDKHAALWRCKFAPNRAGTFKALIMAKRRSEPGSYTSTVSFNIIAEQTPLSLISFPKTWQLFYDLDMQIKTPKGQGTIVLSKKESEVEIQITTPDNVDLLSRLSDDNDQEIRDGSLVFFDKHATLWRCKFAPNRAGMFKALIMAKRRSDPGSYTSAVSFIIEATHIPSPPLSFPETWQLFYDLGLKVEAPINSANAIWPDNASYAEVLIQAPDHVRLSCRIEYNGVKIENGSLAQYDHEKKLWQLLFAPQQIGLHELIVYGRQMNDTKTSSKAVVKFNLDVTQLSESIKFPITYNQFQTTKCRIYTPLNGIVKKGAVIPIHCVIPGAIEVGLKTDLSWLKNEGYNDPILQRQITADAKEITIYAKYGDKSNYDGLFKYTVE